MNDNNSLKSQCQQLEAEQIWTIIVTVHCKAVEAEKKDERLKFTVRPSTAEAKKYERE